MTQIWWRGKCHLLAYTEVAILDFLLEGSPNHVYRTTDSIVRHLRDVRGFKVSEEDFNRHLDRLLKDQLVWQPPGHNNFWGHCKRVFPHMDMSREERSLDEQELWDKAHPLDPAAFKPGPKNQMMYDSIAGGGGEEEVLPQHRRDHQAHMRNLIMSIDRLPVNLIVKALSDALAHAREVAVREHIKADRIERVNQFIVSLRRHFGYLPDSYRTEREYLSAQLCRKEVWYDVGVVNPPSKSGLAGLNSASLKSSDVEKWLAQAEAMTPTFGDLKADIERDLQNLQGSIIVAEACNKTVVELQGTADKLLIQMADLAEEI